MEGTRRSNTRDCQQCYESSRIEEELWLMAYQRVLPFSARSIQLNVKLQSPPPAASRGTVPLAKGA